MAIKYKKPKTPKVIKTQGPKASYTGVQVGNVKAGVTKGAGYRAVSFDTPKQSYGINATRVKGGAKITVGSDTRSKTLTIRKRKGRR